MAVPAITPSRRRGAEAERAPYAPMRHRPTPDRWTPALIVAALQAWTAESGDPPRRVEWSGQHPGSGGEGQRRWMREHPRWPSSSCVARHFGSWSAGLRAAGLRARAPAFTSSVSARVLEARRLAAQGVRVRAIAARLDVSVASAYNYLAASDCPLCGGPVTSATAERCGACRRHEPTVPGSWTREEVGEAIRAWAALTGSAPSYRDWTPDAAASSRWIRESPRWPSAAAVCRHYAGDVEPWNAALRDAGLRPRARRWSDDAVRRALAGFWAREGRPPRPSDLAAAGWDGPCPATFRRRYGSVAAAWAALSPAPSG